jgi:alkylhydroperoxidase family enzyme
MTRIAPVTGTDAIRARLPAALDCYAETRTTVLEGGLVDRDLKELCARYLADDPEVTGFASSDRFSGRERAALEWTHAIAYDSDRANADLWRRLHEQFSEPELVELGYYAAFVLGQTHWLRTLGVKPLGEVSP